MKESSDNQNRPRKLEEVFRDGFDPAEVTPSDKLWNRIEQELDGNKVSYYKKHLAWYRGIAAASILLLMLAMGYFWYDTQTIHKGGLGSNNQEIAASKNRNLPNPPDVSTLPENTTIVDINKDKGNNRESTRQSVALKKSSPETILVPTEPGNKLPRIAPSTFANTQPGYAKQGKSAINKPLAVPDKMPAKLSPETRQQVEEAESTAIINVEKSNLYSKTDEDRLNTNDIEQKANKTTLNNQTDTTRQLAQSTVPVVKTDSLPALTASASPDIHKSKKSKSRWAIGGGSGSQFFQQNISFADGGATIMANAPNGFNSNVAPISRNLSGSTIEDAKEEFNKNTQSAFSYRTAMAVSFRLNDKWSLEGGLTFTENQAQTNTTYIIHRSPGNLYNLPNSSLSYDVVEKSNGLPDNVNIPVTIFLAELTENYLDNSNVIIDKVDPFTMYYRYRQVGVPLKIRFQQNKGKWFNYVSVGGAINMLLQTSIIADSPRIPTVEYMVGQSSPFRQWNLTALGSVGRGIRLSEVWQVQGSFDFSHNLSDLIQGPVSMKAGIDKPYYLGLGFSTSYVVGRKATK